MLHKSIQILILFGGFDFAWINSLNQALEMWSFPSHEKILQSDLFTDFPKMVPPSSEPRLDDAIEKLKNMIHNDGQSSPKVSFEFSSNPVKNLHFIILIFSSVASLDRKETFWSQECFQRTQDYQEAVFAVRYWKVEWKLISILYILTNTYFFPKKVRGRKVWETTDRDITRGTIWSSWMEGMAYQYWIFFFILFCHQIVGLPPR